MWPGLTSNLTVILLPQSVPQVLTVQVCATAPSLSGKSFIYYCYYNVIQGLTV